MRGVGVACAILLSASTSLAQPTPADVSLAQSLFEEGTDLMRRGKYPEACPKLAESQRLDPGGGTLMNLAVCLEKEGRLASAYNAYNEALAVAERDGNKTREATARDRIAVVGPMVARVVIKVSPAAQALDSLEVRFDTASVRRAAWGVAAPVDMGEHVVTATATGKREWRGVVPIEKPGAVVEVNVPALDDLPAAPPPIVLPVVTPAKETRSGNTQRTAGWSLVAAGGAATVIGIVFAGVAALRHSDSQCSNGMCPTAEGVSAERDANTLAWGANISFGTALALAGTGAVLLFTAPKSKGVTPAFGPSFVGLFGRF